MIINHNPQTYIIVANNCDDSKILKFINNNIFCIIIGSNNYKLQHHILDQNDIKYLEASQKTFNYNENFFNTLNKYDAAKILFGNQSQYIITNSSIINNNIEENFKTNKNYFIKSRYNGMLGMLITNNKLIQGNFVIQLEHNSIYMLNKYGIKKIEE